MRLTDRFRVILSPSSLWRGAPVAALVFLLGVMFITPADTSAHAFLDRSDPEANMVLPGVPDSVRLWFTEPLEVQYSRIDLYDANGNLVDTDDSFISPDDPYLMILPLPADLPNGTYSAQWRNVSTADGHPEQGYVPFTIGTQADVVIPVPPAQVDFGGPRAEIAAVGRWLSLLGVAGVAGTIVTWFWVVLPSFGALAEVDRSQVARRMRLLALVSVGVAILGSFAALAAQVSTVGSALSVPDTLAVINDTRFGTLWMIRVALLMLLGVYFYLPHTWSRPDLPMRWVGVGLAAAAMLPYALNSHAAAPGEGRAAAIVADWIHLGASSVWVGGLLTLLVGVIYAARRAPRESRREVYAEIIPRFSTLAIASVVILTVTGLYASWLQVGSLTALRETSYGQTLVIKVGLMWAMIIVGAVNLLWIGPQMRTAARSSIHFGRTVAVEVVLGVLVLFMVGLLTSLPTARDTIAAETGRTVFHIGQGDLHVSLYVTPGAVGNNRYTADFSPSTFPDGSQAILRFTPQNDLEGIREAQLLETEPGRYETSGTELSVTGDWNLELILRRPNTVDWRVTAETNIQSVPAEARAPSPAPRMPGMDGAIWVLVLSSSILVMVWGFRRPSGRGVVWFGTGLLVLSLAGLAFNHERPVAGATDRNPIAMTAESIERGEALFAEHCAACHGPAGRGDGEQLAGVNVLRADLTAPHLFDHTEGELHWWITHGIGGTLMPGFDEQLTDEDIWHLVNYVYYLNERESER
jgi:copper transport protein